MVRRPVERPLGVTLIAILLALNGIVALLGGIALIVTGSFVGGVISLIFGLALLYVAYGMWTLQEWAWLATVVIEGLNALFSLITVVTSPGSIGSWISLILSAVIVIYLLQPSVRADFERWRGAV